MMEPALRFGTRLVRYLGKAIEPPKEFSRYISIAVLSVAETLLQLVRAHFVRDIVRVKESLIQKIEAETDEKRAEADRKLAEAAEAANRTALYKRHGAIARAERQLRQAEVAKTEAEAEAIRMDAETRRIEAKAKAQAKLLETIAKLRSEGGDVFFSEDNLKQILRLEQPNIGKTKRDL